MCGETLTGENWVHHVLAGAGAVEREQVGVVMQLIAAFELLPCPGDWLAGGWLGWFLHQKYLNLYYKLNYIT